MLDTFVKKDARPVGELVEKCTMSFGSATSLDRFKAYKFFSPALPYLFGGFTDEPLAQFLHEYGKDVDFMYHLFAKPIFRGMDAPDGDVRWNHALWAVRAEVWPALENFLLSVVVTDTPSRSAYRIGAQDVTVVDPLWVETTTVLAAAPPLLDIVVLGVDSTRGIMAVERPLHPTHGLPAARLFKADKVTRKFADLLFKDNPVGAVDALTPAAKLPDAPVDLRTQPLDAMSPEKRAEYLAAIGDYRKGFNT